MISTHVYRAELVGTGPLDLKGGRVTLDASRWPHVQASITVPADAAMLDLLDPRDGGRVRLVADATFPTDTQTRTFDLGIRRMTPKRESGEVALLLSSDEAVLEDYAPLAKDRGARAFESSVRGVVNYALSKIGAHLEPGTADADVTAYWEVKNQLQNPSSELSPGPWSSGGNCSVFFSNPAIAGNPAGASACGFTSSAAGELAVVPHVPFSGPTVTPGKSYVFSGYGRRYQAPARTIRACVRWLSAANVPVGPDVLGDALPLSDVNWAVRPFVIATAPAGAAKAEIFWRVNGSTAANQIGYIDGAMWYEGDELVPYFDGATPADAHYTYAWAGNAHASASTRTPRVERRPELFEWRPGDGGVTFLGPLVQATGMRLVCDGDRRWTLRDADWRAPGVSAIRWGVNLIAVGEEASRESEDWFDGAVFSYVWRTPDGIEHARDDAYAEPGATKIIRREIRAPYPGPGRAEYAVKRARGKGRTIDATAVSDWTAACDQLLTVTIDEPGALVGVAEKVEFDLSTDRMTISSRTTDIPPGAIDLLPGIIDALPGTIDSL